MPSQATVRSAGAGNAAAAQEVAGVPGGRSTSEAPRGIEAEAPDQDAFSDSCLLTGALAADRGREGQFGPATPPLPRKRRLSWELGW